MEYTIVLTDSCNMRCKYCYQGKDKSSNFMTIDKLRESLDFIFKNNNEDKLSLSLFGGEPLLKKELLYETVRYVNEKYGNTKVKYSTTTNCTLIDDEIINFFKENNFDVRVSIDGDKKTHELNRIGNGESCKYETILENIMKIKNAGIKFSIRMTLTKNNFRNLVDNVKYFYNLGFREICLGMDYFNEFSDAEIEDFREKITELKEYYLELIDSGENLTIDIFDGKFLSALMDEQRGLALCAGGYENFKIATDGRLYPCSFVMNSDEFNVGDVSTGANTKITTREINKSMKKNYTKCNECEISFFCHGMKCGFLNYKATGYINVPPKILCDTEHILFDVNKEIISHLVKRNNPKIEPFFNYLNSENIPVGKLIQEAIEA